MKFKILYLSLIVVALSLYSCVKFENKDDLETEATDSISDTVANPSEISKTEIYGPIYTYNDTLGIPVKKNAVKDDLSPEELIGLINKHHGTGKINLTYVETSNDTIYVKIDDSAYLTQQMGTLGPHAYMATVTFTLTELPNVKYVNFNFEEGDHAAPGTYTRTSFAPNPQ